MAVILLSHGLARSLAAAAAAATAAAAAAGLGLAFTAAGGAQAQSATMAEIQALATNVTVVNGGGFGIVSDGSLLYDGPLNAITPLPAFPEVRVVINERVLLEGLPMAVQDLVDSGQARRNGLSAELVRARVDVSERDTVMLGIAGREPMPTALGGGIEVQRSEQVSGQSFSVFPDFLPSVFTRSGVLP